jgi:hypothetical protein
MPQSPTAIPSVITIENTDGIILSVKFSREKNFWRASPSVRPSVFGFFLFLIELATERGITDDQDGRIPSVMPLVRILPTNCMPYTDGMNPSVKLFNGVVKTYQQKVF